MLYYSHIGGISDMLNGWQTKLTLQGVAFLVDERAMVADMLVVSKGLFLQVSDACNGLLPWLIYASGVLAYRMALKEKLFWIVLGYVLLTIANIVRIVGVYQLSKVEASWFDMAHSVLGNLFMACVAGGLLMLLFSRHRPVGSMV